MRLPAARWIFSLPAAIFYCLITSAMYETLDSPSGAPAFAALLAQLFLASSIALWLLTDARRRGQSLHCDAGLFFFLAWPLLAPTYLFSTRGWRAFGALGWFLLLYFGAALFGRICYFFFLARHR